MGEYLKEGLSEYLLLRAKSREKRLAADHPLVEQFWDTYEYISTQLCKLKGREEPLNHENKPGVIAVNFNQYMEACRNSGQTVPDIPTLKKLLPTSSTRRFVASNRCIYSRHEKKNVKCWVFHEASASAKEA